MKAKTVNGLQRLQALQLLLIMMLTLLMLAFSSSSLALSALLGGLVAWIPSLVFARKLFRYKGARAAKDIVRSFYSGEVLKLTITFLLFLIVFTLFKIRPLPFFLTYIMVIMMHWFSPLIIKN
jgi:ATP synthase protein I